MRTDRRLWLKALASLPLAAVLPALAGDLEAIRQRGRLRVAVYNDFMPYSKAGKGIDVELARAIAGFAAMEGCGHRILHWQDFAKAAKGCKPTA